MVTPKQIQIDWELFSSICDFFFSEDSPSGYEADRIRAGLSVKIDKIISRELFSKYKRSPTGLEREQARQEYLNHKGISKAFRSDSELLK